MPTQLQLRRGNTAQTATFTGAVAEITVDTDKKTIVVHDGTTPGGFPLALQSTQFDQLAFTKANLAFDRANSSFAQANLAYDAANTKFNSTGGTISGNVIVTGNITPNTDNIYSLGSASKRWKDLFVGPGSINIDGIVIGNNGGQIVISGASDFVFQSTTGAPSVSSSASANIAINAFNQANLAFSKANSANGIAVSAFAQANLAYDAANTAVTTGQANVGAGLITVTGAYQVNVGAGLIGVTSAYQANVGAARIADVASSQANVGASIITVSNNITNVFNQANLAFNTANNALPKTGGTITGDLAVTGNLIITGTTTTLNVTSLSVSDTLIQLGKENQTDLLDIGFIGRYANTPNNHTGLIRKFSDGKYYLFDNLQTNVDPTNIIDIANTRVATLSANLVTNVITLRGLDPLDYSNTIYSNAQANVGQLRIDVNTANNSLAANIGAGRIADVASGQANVGASIITVSNNITNVFNQANLAYDAANSVVTTSQANVGAGLISTANTVTLAYQANVGAGLITVTSAYQVNVGAGLISTANTVTLAYQANTGAAALAGQANVGAGLISTKTAYEANVGSARIDANTANTTLAASIASGRQADNANLGASIITVTNAYEANVGAGLISTANTVTLAYQANVGSGLLSTKNAYEANVGAGLISTANTVTLAYQANVGAGLITVTSAYEANVGAGLISTANTVTLAYQANVGSAIAQGQANVGASVITLSNNITNVFNQANLAYNAANSVVTTSQANIGASIITVSNNITNVFNQANLAYDAANSAVTTGQANVGAAVISVTSAYQANVGAGLISTKSAYEANVGAARISDLASGQANIGASVITLTTSASNAFNHANSAFNKANNALPTTGGSIAGDLTVSGNLTISGTTTTLNVTSLSVTDTLIQLGTQNQSDLLDIGFIGHYANTPNNHTGLIRKFSDGKYYLFDNLLTNNEPTNTIDIANTRVATLSANLITNVITLRGLDPLDYSNTIYSNAQANTGAAVISVTSAYQANVGSARIDANIANTTLAASIASGRQADNANVGASIIAVTSAYQANVGSGLISVTSAYQANVGAGLLTKLNLTGGTVAGNITVNSVITNNSIYSPVIYSTGALSRLDLSDIGLVGITVAGQTFQFGGSGIEANKGIFGGSFGGNRISLDNETNVISNRYDTVKIQTGTTGNVSNEWSFANNQLIFPDSTYQNTAFRGVAVDQTSRNTANLAYDAANSAVTTGQANVGAGLISTTSAITSAYQANVGAGLISTANTVTSAYQANVGAGLISTKSAYEANVGAGLISTKSAYEANVGVEVAARSANVGAAVISITTAYQANVGAGLISTANTVTSAYQANVGAGLISSAVNINATDDTASNASFYPVFVGAVGSIQTAKGSSTKLYFNPSTGTLNATIFNSLSDINSKQNIETIQNSLEKVLQLRGVSFEWIDNNNKAIGLIAQEVEPIVPEVVNTNEDGIKSVSYDSIVGLLIEAIKEQQKQIDELKKQITGENK